MEKLLRRTRRYLTFLTVFAVAGLMGCMDDNLTNVAPEMNAATHANESAAHTYRITFENLTSGQPFSPAAIATHTRRTSFFDVGENASEGIRMIAENGNNAVALMELADDPEVDQVVTNGSLTPPGGTATVEITARADANYLSMAVMLGCTNDGFTGLSSVRLPGGFKADVYYPGGYDAGTEVNLETSESLADACLGIPDGNVRNVTNEPIMHHAGINGNEDLSSSVHGWTDPVARITVQRID